MLDEEPELDEGLGWYWSSFWRLRRSAGSEPIAISEVVAFCDLVGLGSASAAESDERALLLDFVQAMDAAYLEVSSDLREKRSAAQRAQDKAKRDVSAARKPPPVRGRPAPKRAGRR